MPLKSISLPKNNDYLGSQGIDEKNKDINLSFMKMVYGIGSDIDSFKQNSKNTITLDDLNLICGISAQNLKKNQKKYGRNFIRKSEN